jgi:hypothetical protein
MQLQTYPRETIDKIRQWAAEEIPVREQARRLNITKNKVSSLRWRLRLTDPSRNPVGSVRSPTQEEIAHIIQLRRSGKSIPEIREMTGRSKGLIERELHKAGLSGKRWCRRRRLKPGYVNRLKPPRLPGNANNLEENIGIPIVTRYRPSKQVKETGGKCEMLTASGEYCGRPAIYNPSGRRTYYCFDCYSQVYQTCLRVKPVAQNAVSVLGDD